MAFKKLKLWFDKDLAKLLANNIIEVKPDFAKKQFIQAVDKKVPDLELKDRVEAIADELYKYLGEDYEKGLHLLMQTLGPENEEETGMFTNFYWIMPIAKYVEKYGLKNHDISMKAIEEITKRNTGEYTIRPFIEKAPKKTLKRMLKWSKAKNRHIRRLASEGVRPRLPWASKLDMFIENPELILPILNNLKDDSSKYVQKSVANCINDILKDNFEIAQSLLEEWKGTEDISKERKWIIKHSLRNLLKKDNEWAKQMVK